MLHRPSPPTGRHFRGAEPLPSRVEQQFVSENPDPAEARRRAAERAAKAAAEYAMRTTHAQSSAVDAEANSLSIAQRVREMHATRPAAKRRRESEGMGDTRAVSRARRAQKKSELSHSPSSAGKDAQKTSEPGKKSLRPSRKTTQRELKAPRNEASYSPQNSTQAPVKEANVARSSMVMFLGTLVSRALGLVRSPILLGAIVGLNTPAADAFAVANKIPNLIYMIVVGGLVNAVLVPSIVRATKESDDNGASFLNKLLTLTVVFLGSITLLLTLGAPWVVKLFASTMDAQWYDLTVAFAFWCLPQIFFYGLYTVLGQILNARENFGPYMWAPVVNNVIAVLGFVGILLVFGGAESSGQAASDWTSARVVALGGVSTLGIVTQALVLIWPMRTLGITFRPDFAWRGSGLGDAGRASWWMLLMMLTSIVPTMLVSNVAAGARSRAQDLDISTQLVAGNATYDNAYALYSLPTSLIVVSIATAMFTRLSKAAVDGDLAKMRRDTSKTLRVVSTLMIFSSAVIIALAVPLTRIVAFTVDPQETVVLAQVLIAMSLGLVGVGAVIVLDRVYYAFEDTRGAFRVNLPFQALGVVGFLICGVINPRWTVIGVGLVMSATNILAFITMVVMLSRRMNGLDELRLLRVHVKLAGIGAFTVLVGWAIQGLISPIFAPLSLPQAILRCLLLVPILIAVFFGSMKFLRMEELGDLSGPLGGLARKLGLARLLPKKHGEKQRKTGESSLEMQDQKREDYTLKTQDSMPNTRFRSRSSASPRPRTFSSAEE